MAVAILVVDFLIYKLIFTLGYELIVTLTGNIQEGYPLSAWFSPPLGFVPQSLAY
jgi:hypothetical protein